METIISSNPHGVNEQLTYDDLNRLATVVYNNLPAGSNTTSYSYDPSSNVATVSYPNSLISSFTYDTLNRLTELSTPPVADYKYTLGLTGNRVASTEQSGRATNWSYDGIYRLTNETIASDPSSNNGSVAYGLDPVGNRLTESATLPGLSSASFTYNADDELSTETYDANGNVLTTGGMAYTYDSENHMISATGNGKVITMVYDAFGNRVSKTVNGVTTQYLVEDDVNPTGYSQVLEEVRNGAAVRTYTYGLQRINENQVMNGAWTPSFYGYDGGGSVRQLTNSAGVVTDEYEYDAFGNSFTISGTTPNNYLYRGEQYDPDLGLYYLRARYYNPLTGRFLSRDPNEPKFRDANGKPIDPRYFHKYLYANGDPINGIDPTGRATMTKPQSGLGGAIGEWAAILTNISIRVFIVTQVLLPMYVQGEAGAKAVYILVTGSALAIGLYCEYLDIANTFNQLSANMQGPNATKPPFSCIDGADGGAGDSGGEE